MKETILSAKDLCKSFASNGTQNHVLDDISLELFEGDFTVIMGASGSGKSTLLYCLSGMDSLTSGEVSYKGKKISGCKEKEMARLRAEEFGFVFQQIHLVSNLTLLENVTVPGFLDKKKPAADVKKRALDLLEQVNVLQAKDRLPAQVSGGEAQRAAIARAVIGEPGLLFADEPTGALNKSNTDAVLNLMTDLNREGQSILMVTHDVRAALRADRLLYLEDGKICGEMKMAPFTREEARNRETQINAWLSSMEW